MPDLPSPFDDPRLLEEESRRAVAQAIRGSLESNVPVVYREGGAIIREHPDGRRELCAESDDRLVASLPALGLLDPAAAVPLQPVTPGKKILRVFAGPNGSGKSTIYEYIARRYESGAFINPDRINAELERDRTYSLAPLGLPATTDDVLACLRRSSWGWEDVGSALISAMRVEPGPTIRVDSERLSYAAAIIADVVRNLMMDDGRHFSVETVMSHPSKLELMWEARRRGYTCYLYYVCTDSPTINVERVRTRVGMGGHDVPTASITARYHRSLLLLRPAIALAYRAFLFDNSEKVTDQKSDAGRLLCLEFKEGAMLHRFRRSLPPWIDRFGGPIGGVQSDVELS